MIYSEDVTSKISLLNLNESQYGVLASTDFTLTQMLEVESGCVVNTDFTLNSAVVIQMFYNSSCVNNLNLSSKAPGVRQFSYIVPVESFDPTDLIETLAEFY